mmetsp:Transcript_52070/g.83004  ORF Transcript_52070/g.83004 Transcript_52070/m.83004 type:complete len:280 (+) Transcript_52070:36-875(+)|eukprot:CAMPEP_0197030668 /NCGR_PEP_ID=MMETSP1384-20130603/9853_1 /TAXON_ID=29189 /ORGANISM="Ammonia sp." /LENGTH=279 /DNA_ID=CAMNT_0042460061 /DNA_START=33 /DNA_END=872 /DNA_ORIENTATION=+
MAEEKKSENTTTKYALVTGASCGMGAHLAKTLLELDWRVIMISRQTEKMKRNVPKGKEQNAKLMSVDLSNMEQCESACKQIVEHLNTECDASLNLLVHAAGASKPGLSIEKCSLSDWNWQMNLNAASLFLLTKYMTPSLAKGHGSIVNISSVITSTPFIDASIHAVAKGAVDTFTKAAALELAPKKIRVNCIAPGVVKTEFGVNMGFPKEGAMQFVKESAKYVPLQRYGECNDVTQLVLFLADNEKSGWITGQIIKLDGGRSCVDIGSGYPIVSNNDKK